MGKTVAASLNVLEREYELTTEEAEALFRQTWIYTFGIGTLCATGVCFFSKEELEEMLGHSFISMLMFIKAGRLNEVMVHPEKKAE